jgi:hypothetical protein
VNARFLRVYAAILLSRALSLEVGAVGGEIKRNCAARLDCFFDSVDFVDAD